MYQIMSLDEGSTIKSKEYNYLSPLSTVCMQLLTDTIMYLYRGYLIYEENDEVNKHKLIEKFSGMYLSPPETEEILSMLNPAYPEGAYRKLFCIKLEYCIFKKIQEKCVKEYYSSQNLTTATRGFTDGHFDYDNDHEICDDYFIDDEHNENTDVSPKNDIEIGKNLYASDSKKEKYRKKNEKAVLMLIRNFHESNFMTASNPAADDVLIKDENHKFLKEFMNYLLNKDPLLHEIIMLRYHEHLNPREISERTNINKNTIYSWINFSDPRSKVCKILSEFSEVYKKSHY